MTRRDVTATALTVVVLLAAAPAYDRVFADAAWRTPAVIAVAAATVAHLSVRLLRRGVLTAAVVSLLVFLSLLPWLTGLADLPRLPTPARVGELLDVARLGWSELIREPAPAPSTPGLTLLATTGWWAASFTALELVGRDRRCGFGLVAVLVLWSVPLTISSTSGSLSVGATTTDTLVFLGAAGLLLLGTAPRRPGDGRVLGGVAVGAVVLVAAVSAPWLLPGYGEPSWVALGSADSPRGYQPIVDVTTRLHDPEPRDVLQVRSSQPTYLRLAGLDHFDGGVWRLGDASAGAYQPDPGSLTTASQLLPPEREAARTEIVETDITVLDLENIYVPVPYQPVEVLGPLRDDLVWSTEGGFLTSFGSVTGSDGDTVSIRQGAQYRVRAARPTPTADELDAVVFDPDDVERYTQLPREFPRLAEEAEAVYEEAGAESTVERALALQEWFVGDDRFTYDLEVPALRGADALTDFVLEDRVGYCEYFASAMAVMLRETGIPARVAVGFLPGREVGEAEGDLTEYVVSTTDAHAWVEVLFPGYGWVTFEPTPRSDESHLLPRVDNLAPTQTERERRLEEALAGEGGDASTPVEELEPEIEVPEGDGLDAVDPEDAAAGATADDTAGGLVTGLIGLVVAVAVGLFVLGAVRRRATAVAEPRRRVVHARDALLSSAAALGAARRRHETTPEVLARWDAAGRTGEARSLGGVLQAAAFGGDVSEDDATRAEVGVTVAIEELRRSATWRERLLAPGRRLLLARWR